MKTSRYLLLIALVFFSIGSSYAQMIADPTTWTTEIKKKSANTYQVIFHLSLKSGWHVYAKTKGMDESLIVPSFTFDKNNGYTLNGATETKGTLITKKIEGVGMVSMYSDKVVYTQTITAKKGTKVSGSYTYQTCNETTCLPPKTKTFSLVIKS